MKQALFKTLFFTFAAFGTSCCLPAASSADNWPEFRGVNCSGVSATAKPPVQISPTNGVKWKVEVPWSPSSPCVWGDQVFLTTYTDGELQTRAYSAKDGALLWTKGIKPEKLEMFHRSEGSPAASTPATDGRRVVSYFGSFGLVCYDFKGAEVWRHPLPLAMSGGGFGTGTSPVILRDRVLLNRDQDDKSSLQALDLSTGKQVWETPRPDAGGSFGTPILWNNSGEEEVIVPGSIQLKGYALKTGSERWVVDGMVGFACTTPVVGEGMVYFGGWSPGKADSPWPTWEKFLATYDKGNHGAIVLDELDVNVRDFIRGMDRNHDGRVTKEDWDIVQASAAKAENVVVAVKAGGKGDISKTHVAWKVTKGLPYVPSPLYYKGRVYLVKDGGMMSSIDAKTGTPYYTQERLDEASGSYYSSPIAADDRIYVVSLTGKLSVVKAGGDKPEIIHQASFGERVFATPAPVEDKLYLRTETKLYAF
jgi:outer membrane protein assembly factor BamB